MALHLKRLLPRCWFYLRIGYSLYFVFLLGFSSTLVTLYYLAIKNMPVLLAIFPQFEWFALIACAIGIPLAVMMGWLHYKRMPMYSSEVEVGQEANPYNFKLVMGLQKDVFWPVFGLMLKSMSGEKLSQDEQAECRRLGSVIDMLVKGGSLKS